MGPVHKYIVGEIPTLVDHHEAALLLEDTIKQEMLIDVDVCTIIKDNTDLDDKLLHFQAALPLSLQPIFAEAAELLSTVTDTCELAESVSRKVRDLDHIRARVLATNKKVDDIIDLKHCADIVKKAMATEDYETAAEHIQKYMGFTTGQNAIDALEPMAREGQAHEAITNAELQLKNLIRQKLEQSLAHDNQDEIMRFCELYAKLGMKEEGLTRYCHYLRKTCSSTAEKILKQYLYGSGRLTPASAPSEPPLSATAALTQIFEAVAVVIEDQVPVVDAHFGSGSAITMIRNMVEQCNTHTNRIVELFMENHAVTRKMDFVTDKGRIAEKDRDPRVLTATLDEMVSICKSAEFYIRFITKKVLVLPLPVKTSLAAYQRSAGQGQGKITNTEIATTMNSELSRKVQEIISCYISLEEYFMVESVQKAIKMDEQSIDSQTSSMVDYVFFVLQQSSQRAVEANNIYGLCASMNHIMKCLDNYKEVLIRSFKDQAAKALLGRATDSKNSHLIALNNLDVSSEYILRLKSEIEAKTAGERNMFSKPEDQEKVKTALADLLEVSKKFKQTLEMNMKQFCASLQPRTRTLLDLFADVNYEISDQEYANNEINDPFAQMFIAEATQVLKPFCAGFTPTNYDLFIHLLVASIVEKLEKSLMQKRVNQLGALQFDKDLMTISAHFSSITIQSVRDKFARLSQMANLLTTENISEVSEIWGENSGKITWRLTPTEVRKVLMLRVDYPPDQITKLKL